MIRTSVQRSNRRGAVLVLMALLLTVFFSLLAFTVDLGYLSLVKMQLQRTADAAAHAAATGIQDQDDATDNALAIANITGGNQVAGSSVQLKSTDVVFGLRSADSAGIFTYQFPAPPNTWNCVQVTTRRTNDSAAGAVPTFFAPLFGVNNVDMTATATATVGPRDIVLVIDLSGSMHHDSEPWSWPAQNFISSGQGDSVRDQLWEEMGLTDAGVDFANMKAGNTETLRSNNYDFEIADNNLAIKLPRLKDDVNGTITGTAGKTLSATQSRDEYNRKLGAGKTWLDANNNIFARLNYTDSDGIMSEFGSNTSTKRKFVDLDPSGDANLSNWYKRYTEKKVSSIGALDMIAEQYLMQSMGLAKPPLNDATYRPYWRSYMFYLRGKNGGVGNANDDKGMNGWANPCDASSVTNIAADYKDSNGISASTTDMASAFQSMYKVANYKSYIQFMMDMGSNNKVGIDGYGHDAASAGFFTAMSMRWDDPNESSPMPSEHAYRIYSDTYEKDRPLSEQPASSVSSGVLAFLKTIHDQNEYFPANLRDRVAICIYGSSGVMLTNQSIASSPSADNKDPFLDCVADYDEILELAIRRASQGFPNGTSNVDNIGGGTNTQHAMQLAYEALRLHSNPADKRGFGRDYSDKWAVLFTDGQPTSTTTPGTITSAMNATKIDLDGSSANGAEANYFYGTNTSSGTNADRNAALRQVYVMAQEKMRVHTVSAGASRDADICKRMSKLTSGIFRDSGSSGYTSLLVSDFQKLANMRPIKLAIP